METILFKIKEKELEYVLETGSKGYFLNNYQGMNSEIFDSLKMSKYDKSIFVEKILGYSIGGDFPYTKSRDDMDKLIDAIRRLINPEINLLCL